MLFNNMSIYCMLSIIVVTKKWDISPNKIKFCYDSVYILVGRQEIDQKYMHEMKGDNQWEEEK